MGDKNEKAEDEGLVKEPGDSVLLDSARSEDSQPHHTLTTCVCAHYMLSNTDICHVHLQVNSSKKDNCQEQEEPSKEDKNAKVTPNASFSSTTRRRKIRFNPKRPNRLW